ncbi:HD domain-containing protein [Cronobacter malonaticus]|uniref:HD domain-containing protein n=1 Tax=Cronobacter malonaticus TaxID=413503 RepID=UPI000CFAAE64|nr:HD domain-containing protein [Cronobacter malonaticus]
MDIIIDKARTYATAAHGAVGQRRKYTNEPYITHPTAVAELVRAYGGTRDMIAPFEASAHYPDCVE